MNKDQKKTAQPAQVPYLESLSGGQASVTAYLVNGIKLRGSVISFDNHTMLLSGGPVKQLVYKHAVSTIVIDQPTGHKTSRT